MNKGLASAALALAVTTAPAAFSEPVNVDTPEYPYQLQIGGETVAIVDELVCHNPDTYKGDTADMPSVQL